ncbi:MAG: phosphopantetheine-binding protein [Desulfosalsimonadaceae bacterium]
METLEIFNRVVKIISEFVKEPERLENISMDTLIIQDLKVNSARLVDIIIQSEDAFDIGIDDDDADQIKTIGDAVRVVERKLVAA